MANGKWHPGSGQCGQRMASGEWVSRGGLLIPIVIRVPVLLRIPVQILIPTECVYADQGTSCCVSQHVRSRVHYYPVRGLEDPKATPVHTFEHLVVLDQGHDVLCRLPTGAEVRIGFLLGGGEWNIILHLKRHNDPT